MKNYFEDVVIGKEANKLKNMFTSSCMIFAEAFALLHDFNDTAKRIAAMELHKTPLSIILSPTAI